jgi:hypothetical protein
MRDNKFVMRIKNILSFIAFGTAFIISAAFATALAPRTAETYVPSTYSRTNGQSISRFLQQDIRNGQDRNRQVYRYDDSSSLSSPYLVKRAQAVSDYSEASAAMDFNHLPQDFQLAWLKHMRAWHNYADFLQKAKTQEMSYGEISQLENQFNREINLTWYDTLRVAGRYGAVVNEY